MREGWKRPEAVTPKTMIVKAAVGSKDWSIGQANLAGTDQANEQNPIAHHLETPAPTRGPLTYHSSPDHTQGVRGTR